MDRLEEVLRNEMRLVKECEVLRRDAGGGTELGVFELERVSSRDDGPWFMVTSEGPEMLRRPLLLLLFLLKTLMWTKCYSGRTRGGGRVEGGNGENVYSVGTG